MAVCSYKRTFINWRSLAKQNFITDIDYFLLRSHPLYSMLNLVDVTVHCHYKFNNPLDMDSNLETRTLLCGVSAKLKIIYWNALWTYGNVVIVRHQVDRQVFYIVLKWCHSKRFSFHKIYESLEGFMQYFDPLRTIEATLLKVSPMCNVMAQNFIKIFKWSVK